MFNTKFLAALCALVAVALSPVANAQSSATGSVSELTFSFSGLASVSPGGGFFGGVSANGIIDTGTSDGTTSFSLLVMDPGLAAASLSLDPTLPAGIDASGAAAVSPAASPNFALSALNGGLFFSTTGAGTLTVTGSYSLTAAASAFGSAEAFFSYEVFFPSADPLTVPFAFFERNVCACFGASDSDSGTINETITFSSAGSGLLALTLFAAADDFGPSAIPEPSTYALMLAGLGLVGFAARRRRRLS